MIHRFGLLPLLILVSLQVFGEEKVYKVQKGDTIYSIARSFGMKSDDLMRFNGIGDPTRLQVGQRLTIPVSPGTPSPGTLSLGTQSEGTLSPGTPAPGKFYQVVRKDTLYGIALRHGVSLRSLIEINGLDERYLLREGDILAIPQGEALGTAGTEGMGTIKAGTGPEETKPEERPREAALPGVKAPGDPPGLSPGTSAPPAPAAPRGIPPVSWPVKARELSYMTGKLQGVMITGNRAEAVKSLTKGLVISAGPYRGFGKVAVVETEGGYFYVYGGCESLLVKAGDKVNPGTDLGVLGIDAVSSKAQLFFLVYRGSQPVDPAIAPRA